MGGGAGPRPAFPSPLRSGGGERRGGEGGTSTTPLLELRRARRRAGRCTRIPPATSLACRASQLRVHGADGLATGEQPAAALESQRRPGWMTTMTWTWFVPFSRQTVLTAAGCFPFVWCEAWGHRFPSPRLGVKTGRHACQTPGAESGKKWGDWTTTQQRGAITTNASAPKTRTCPGRPAGTQTRHLDFTGVMSREHAGGWGR